MDRFSRARLICPSGQIRQCIGVAEMYHVMKH
jgi:hypothetical protein